MTDTEYKKEQIDNSFFLDKIIFYSSVWLILYALS